MDDNETAGLCAGIVSDWKEFTRPGQGGVTRGRDLKSGARDYDLSASIDSTGLS